jgi:hypothetical protein
MATLDKKGYLISIPRWSGNLGNHLIQLTCALNIAKKTKSRLTVPEHNLIKRRVFEFTDQRNENCRKPIEGRFFFRSECFQYPIKYDYERRKLLQNYVYDLLVPRTVRELLRRLVLGTPNDKIGPETLVINIRSGDDIFRTEPPPQKDYMQPPLSFYKYIIESNNYKDFLIVTEAPRKNPCIAALLSWNPRIRIKTHVSIKDDVRTLLAARNLVMCHSTFSWCLALMSKQLSTLHQPASFQMRGIKDFSIHTYEFVNYIKPGQWTCSPEQLGAMLNHSVDDIRVVHKTETRNGGHGESEQSSCG